MSEKVTQWLDQLGLSQFAKLFAEQQIDYEILPELTDADLEKLGIPLGPRKKLLKAAAALESVELARALPAAAESESNLAPWERHPGERKPVTMLFADITGSTALTEKLDAEETHDLLYGATQRMCAAIETHRGTVCRFMGDGVMAMFGAPMASEQHALDACEAALAMQQAIRSYATNPDTDALRIRVGLHSGEVVVLTVGEGDKVEYDASGPTVPIAARMEQSAPPGEVYLTAATHSLARQRIETDALRPVSVKGVSAPVAVFALRRVRSVEEAISDVTRTPFVGRRAELTQFRAALDTTIDGGHGQTIYVRGEPGIGKTRLVEEFTKMAREKGALSLRCLVLPFGVGKGQDAIRSLVRNLLGMTPGGDEDARIRAAQTALERLPVDSDQRVFLNDLLDLPQPIDQKSLYDAMDNTTRNQGKQALVSALVSASSATQPLAIIVEDVHWAGADTLVYLSMLTKTVAECPALLVMTSRIEGDQLEQGWRNTTDGSPFVSIDLGPLRKEDSIALIGEFIDADEALTASCLERAAGNPLFLEQLLRNAREGTAESLPDSIQSLVLARIDRLQSEDKKALQVASVIGQRFTSGALAHLLEIEEYNCRVLVEHSLVRPDGEGYLFAHALIQEGVYGSLLKRQRRALHRKAAEWFVDDLVLHAQHLDYAEDEKAPHAYLMAAREQARQYRYDTALGLIDRGLSCRPQQADRQPLTCLKAELLLDLGDVESSMTVYHQAEQNAEGDHELFDVWMGLAAGMRVKTHYDAGLALLRKAETVAAKIPLTSRLSQLHHLRGNLCFSLGRADECRREHLLALEFSEQSKSAEDEARALGGLGDAEYVRGRMRTANDYYTRCIELSRKHGYGRIEVAHVGQRGWTQLYTGDWRGAKKAGLDAINLAITVGDRRAEMNGSQCVADSVLDLGELELAETYAVRARTLARRLGARAWEPQALVIQALVKQLTGLHGEARDLATRAAEITGETGRAFQAARAFGVLAWIVRDDNSAREAALAEGEKVLREGVVSHGYFLFYRWAMDALIHVNDWNRVERYAAALEDYTREEPLGWTDFIIARGRALATFGRGARDAVAVLEIRRLYDEAQRLGFKAAIPDLEAALCAI